MAVDLLSKMKGFWTSEAIQQLSVMLDEHPDRVGQALGLGAPTILAGLLKSVTGPTDAHRLIDLVKHEPEEMARFGGLSGLLNHLAGLGDVVGLDPLVQYGKAALRTIFGDKLDRVLELIATDSGSKAPTATAVMSLAAASLMGMIRKEIGVQGLTADSLRGLLMAHRDSIVAMAPGMLAETLGVRSLADLGARPTSVVRGPARPVAESSSASLWVLPLGVAIIAAAALIYYSLPEPTPADSGIEPTTTANADKPAVDPDRDATAAVDAIARDDVTSSTVTANGRPVVATAAHLVSLPLPGAAAVEVPEGSYLEAAVKMLRDEKATGPHTFAADDLTFDQDSKLTDASAQPTEHLAAIAKAYPKAKLKIEAREAAGGANDQAERKAVAQKRADSIRDALIAAGVAADRVTAEAIGGDVDASVPAKKAGAVSVVITPQ